MYLPNTARELVLLAIAKWLKNRAIISNADHIFIDIMFVRRAWVGLYEFAYSFAFIHTETKAEKRNNTAENLSKHKDKSPHFSAACARTVSLQSPFFFLRSVLVTIQNADIPIWLWLWGWRLTDSTKNNAISNGVCLSQPKPKLWFALDVYLTVNAFVFLNFTFHTQNEKHTHMPPCMCVFELSESWYRSVWIVMNIDSCGSCKKYVSWLTA